DYRHRLFDRYLPFWDKGGYDDELGGVMVNLNDDGSVADDEKFIWFQGRGLWVYSFLYNNFGKDPRHLERAVKAHDFMVKYMYAGNGTWYQRLNRDGSIKEGVSETTNGWAFIADGLQEFYRATGDEQDLKLVEDTVRAIVNIYDDPDFNGIKNLGGLPENTPTKGLRNLAHSRRFVKILSSLLTQRSNPQLEALVKEHVDIIMTKFYNPEFGIVNEFLQHDYSRIPGSEDYTFIGHVTEGMWIVMLEALRTKNKALFNDAMNIVRKHVEIGWDYIYGGLGAHYYVFDGPGRTREKQYDLKEGWSNFELMIPLIFIVEYTGEYWAKEYYDKLYHYIIKTYDTDWGVWKQSVNRFGGPISRDLYIRKRWHPKRKGNFHQPRAMMYNMLSFNRMIHNKGKLTPFPV
ncbi:MAG: hypothetical protein HOC71_09540, partial [Candidatus Latescibacteria bacterium]|nr:hypothetical protein [Candidatus Latescibacterota bacterium]